MDSKTILAGVLEIAFHEAGSKEGWPCILCHGFPYDTLTYKEVAPILAKEGARVIVPYLRGYGPTRFLSASTPRSGEQAALASDLLALMDALNISKAVLAGYDWGGRAACVVSALWPERVEALVTGNSYNIHDIPNSQIPLDPEMEASLWYQYYFHSERGRRGLQNDRNGIARLLWNMWSPEWNFTDDEFEQTAQSFTNPDFVEVVIHSYRHRYGLTPGDPTVAHIETMLTAQPAITVPTVAIDGSSDGLLLKTTSHKNKFSGPYEYRCFKGAGHNLPQEKPVEWAQAVLRAKEMSET